MIVWRRRQQRSLRRSKTAPIGSGTTPRCCETRDQARPPREDLHPNGEGSPGTPPTKERLHEEFSGHVGRVLPNTMVREALTAVTEAEPGTHACLRLDIKEFYDSVSHEKLMPLVRRRLPDFESSWSTGRFETRRCREGSRRLRFRVPAGPRECPKACRISNVLADIYLGDLDERIREDAVAYFRFVDDLLLIVGADAVETVYEFVSGELEDRGLRVHPLEPQTAKGGRFELNGLSASLATSSPAIW